MTGGLLVNPCPSAFPQRYRSKNQKQRCEPTPRRCRRDLRFKKPGRQRHRGREHNERAEQINTPTTFPVVRKHRDGQQAENDPRTEPQRFLMRKSSDVVTRIATAPSSQFLSYTRERTINRQQQERTDERPRDETIERETIVEQLPRI